MKVLAQVYDVADEDIDHLTAELRDLLARRRFLTLGEHVERFEQSFAAHHGELLATATSSGTSALEAILTALDVRGGEVIVPANTFAATAFAVLHAGARPVFADIGTDLTLDPHDAARRVTRHTRAVVAVHIGGQISPGTLELVELCRDRGIPLVEDAAHAHGSTLHGRTAGAFGIAAAFSFFSTKVITTGEGGMVLTRDPRLHEAVRVMRDQGKAGGGNHHEVVGSNWRLTEMQAMLGLTQVRRLPEFVARRREIAERYRTKLAGVPGLEVVPVPDGAEPNYYKLIALVDGVEPEVLRAELRARHDVALGGYVYEVPLHQQPALRHLAGGPLPVAEDLCRRHICPPIYPSLTDEQLDHVVAAVDERMSSHLLGRGGA
jgi:perosamine synthetase